MEREPARILYIGLVLFAILLALVLVAQVLALVAPGGPDREEVPLNEMPLPLIAVNAILIVILPVAVPVLVLVGISGMMARHPAVARRLIWEVGPRYLTHNSAFGALLLGYLIAILAGASALFVAPDPLSSAAGLAVAAIVVSLPAVVGWYLILVAHLALEPLSLRSEGIALRLTLYGSLFFVSLVVGVNVVGAMDPGPESPVGPGMTPYYPWAEIPAALAGLAAVVVRALVARQAGGRGRRGPASKPAST